MSDPKPKGHWPRGKRRNTDRGDWGVICLAITSLLRDHAEPGFISYEAIGTAVGVNKKTVHKWIDGTNRPDEEMQGMLAAWLEKTRAELKRRKKR